MEHKPSPRQLKKAARDCRLAARMADLTYVTADMDGISRKGEPGHFQYSYKNRPVKNRKTLQRISALVLPPAWTDVWICPSANGHIQATGIDKRGRKQYRYHAEWNALRNETKFHRLTQLGQVLPRLRRQLRKDMALPGLTERKVVATVINLMEETYIRIGNTEYEKQYGSYGLTTLKDRHVAIRKDELRLCFKGKKGVEHAITIRNRKLARIVKQCRDIPGKELFQYYDANGERKSIDSGTVNQYLREHTGMDITAKDFRTWAGTLKAIECFSTLPKPATESERKKNVVVMLDEVSTKLGNTRTVCRKYYVHPKLIRLYEENNFQKWLRRTQGRPGLTKGEVVLMRILERAA